MTVRELAKKLKLSKTTVAAALRGSPVIKKSTRERVQKRARELGYTLNPVASAFLQQIRSRGSVRYKANLALLMDPFGGSQTLEALYQGMCRRAGELGYAVDSIPISGHEASSLTRILVARGVLGVFVGAMIGETDRVALDWDKFAAIAFGYSMARPELHRVVPNHVQCIRTAFNACRAKGFRRIGMAMPEESDARSNGLWFSCFLGLQKKLPEGEQVEPFVAPAREYHVDNLRKWLRREKPEAVIFHYKRLIEPEIFRPPFERLYPVVLDRLPNDPFDGIDQQFGRCGAQLADLLSLQILHNERGIPAHPTITLVDGVWMERVTSRIRKP